MQDSKRDTDVYNSLLASEGEGEGGMIWENSIETRVLLYVKQIANPGWNAWDKVLRAGALGWPWGMGWGGRGVQDGEHMYTHCWFMSMYGKTH